MGLYKSKVQSIFMGSYILPSADDKRRINASREKLSIKKRKYLVWDSGGFTHKKKKSRISRRAQYVKKYQNTQYMGQECL
jgi:hypothetical protein